MSHEETPHDALGFLAICRPQHELHLCSAYALVACGPPFPKFTNNFISVLHYLWSSPYSVAATAVMQILDKNLLFGREPEEREAYVIPNS